MQGRVEQGAATGLLEVPARGDMRTGQALLETVFYAFPVSTTVTYVGNGAMSERRLTGCWVAVHRPGTVPAALLLWRLNVLFILMSALVLNPLGKGQAKCHCMSAVQVWSQKLCSQPGAVKDVGLRLCEANPGLEGGRALQRAQKAPNDQKSVVNPSPLCSQRSCQCLRRSVCRTEVDRTADTTELVCTCLHTHTGWRLGRPQPP